MRNVLYLFVLSFVFLTTTFAQEAPLSEPSKKLYFDSAMLAIQNFDDGSGKIRPMMLVTVDRSVTDFREIENERTFLESAFVSVRIQQHDTMLKFPEGEEPTAEALKKLFEETSKNVIAIFTIKGKELFLTFLLQEDQQELIVQAELYGKKLSQVHWQLISYTRKANQVKTATLKDDALNQLAAMFYGIFYKMAFQSVSKKENEIIDIGYRCGDPFEGLKSEANAICAIVDIPLGEYLVEAPKKYIEKE